MKGRDVRENFLFTPIDSEMWESGYSRYRVHVYATRVFVGEVSQFRSRDAATVKWLAHGADGILRGQLGGFVTRQDAAEALQ